MQAQEEAGAEDCLVLGALGRGGGDCRARGVRGAGGG